MKIYLDDHLDNAVLITILEKSGFEVISPRKIGMQGKKDNIHLKYAITNNAIVLSSDKNFPDPNRHTDHRGILKIYKYNNPKKDMDNTKIARALKNIEKLNLDLNNKIYKLNDFNY